MNIEEVDPSASLKKYGTDIFHVHLGDSNRLMPGKGHTDFKTAFEALKSVGYHRYMALECSTAGEPDQVFPQSVAFLKAVINQEGK